jgi:hypothetical protein
MTARPGACMVVTSRSSQTEPRSPAQQASPLARLPHPGEERSTALLPALMLLSVAVCANITLYRLRHGRMTDRNRLGDDR